MAAAPPPFRPGNPALCAVIVSLKKNCGNAEFECQRHRGVGCGEVVFLPSRGGVWGGAVPPPRKIFQFWILDEFWCKLSAFCTVHLKLV